MTAASEVNDLLAEIRENTGEAGTDTAAPTRSKQASRRLKLDRADAIATRRQRWAWEGRIPLGVVTLFAGRGGEGKSTFALDVIAKLGRGLLDGDLAKSPVPALIVGHEDDWSTVMVPRLTGAGADLAQVYRLAVTTTVDEFTAEAVPVLPLDIALLREAIERTGARVLLIDPITSSLTGDLHKVEAIRKALNPLAALAAEHDLAVIGIMHFNKGGGNVSDKVSGSHAFRDVARSLLLFATDDEAGKRVISFDKSNYSAERGSSLAFDLEPVTVHTDDGEPMSVARVANLAESETTVADIVNRDPLHDERAESDEAADWLVGFLEANGGAAERGAVFKAARAQSFSEKVLRRAREKAGVTANRVGFPSTTKWALPTVVPNSGPVAPTHESGHHRAQLGHDCEAESHCGICGTRSLSSICGALDNAHAAARADIEDERGSR